MNDNSAGESDNTLVFFFQAEDGIRDIGVTGVQTCALPIWEGPWPGVVVVHEAFGLNDDTREQADRLAAAGSPGGAPDLFSAGGAGRCLKRTLGDPFRQDGPAFGDLEAARTWVAGRDGCTGRGGVVGVW